jgi:hypothetical protein
MVIIHIHYDYHEYYHGMYYLKWTDFDMWHASEGTWLIPGTDPEDPFYVESY